MKHIAQDNWLGLIDFVKDKSQKTMADTVEGLCIFKITIATSAINSKS